MDRGRGGCGGSDSSPSDQHRATMASSSSSPSTSCPSSPPPMSHMQQLVENDGIYLHGRVDPGRDENLVLVDAVPVSRGEAHHGNTLLPSNDDDRASQIQSQSILSPDLPDGNPTCRSVLLVLPSEILSHIMSFLGPLDLASISSTCRLLSTHGTSDLSWQRHVQENVPGVLLTSPTPCRNYRELYIAHDPHWFLPKYKLWFCDYFFTGKVIVIRYDPRRGCIEGYRLVAERPPPTFDPWEVDDEVLIHSFKPRCRLHIDQPVLQLDARPLEALVDSSGTGNGPERFAGETPMRIEDPNHPIFSNFFLARPVDERPNMQLWPPPTIPARHRVRNSSQAGFVGFGHKPYKRSDVSNQTFRIRRWMEMVQGQQIAGVHLGEEVYTYATLDPKLYTPTEEKPYRGIWVGDYSGHGCEFLLMNQPDDEEPFDEDSVVQGDYETVEEWTARKRDERIFRGSLEAIKLTGDPNIPRGEYTFVADDLSNAAYIRTATDERFKGARIVKSRGHIAATMFKDDKYIESQLIMISPNRLAQYWVGFGHISFFERVNIDEFLSPLDDRPLNPIE